uniref:Methyltransferase domain-containing protein n=1 Tax=Angiostrongylus cantonensis TaxID=6313 RepID=A0A0K0CTT5_ANGCA
MELHRRIGERLGLRAGMSCVDLGCGIGGVMKNLAPTGANLVGITIAANEVEIGPMEAAWIKNYGDDLYVQRTYPCIRFIDRLAHASKNDKVRRHRPGRDETAPPIERRLWQ